MNLLTRMRVRQAVLSDLSIRKYIFNRNQVFKLKYIPFNIKAFVLTKKGFKPMNDILIQTNVTLVM